MPFTLTGITTIDYLHESGLKSVWEVWREYAYKTSLVVVSLFALASQVKFNCVNDPKVEKDQQLNVVGANAVNSYCKTHFMTWHTRYSSVAAFSGSIILYIVSNFWIHIPGNKERLRYLGRFASRILEHHMTLDEMKKVAVEPVESSSDKRSHAVRENVLILLKSGDRRKLWRWYVIRCFLLLIVLAGFVVLSALYFDSLSIFLHGRDDIVTCYISKSAIGLGTGNLTFTCIDEFTMVDSMLEFVFFCTMIGQLICVLIALQQTLWPCKECSCCGCSGYRDIPHFVTSMADLDHDQAEIVEGFSKYVLADAAKESKATGGGDSSVSVATGNDGSKTFRFCLLENAGDALIVGDDVLLEILGKLPNQNEDDSPSQTSTI